MSRFPFSTVPVPRVVTLASAAALGFSEQQVRRRVRAGVWSELAPGVFCTSPPHEPRDLLRAGSFHAAPHGMLTGAAALLVHGFPNLDSLTRATVLVPYREGIRTTRLVAVRRAVHLPEPVVVDGLAVAPVARATIDHAMTLRWRDDVRALLARAVQRHACGPDELADALGQVAMRGSKLTRAVLAEISAGARSAPEARTAGVLTDGGVVGFTQNASLAEWGLPFTADFLWRRLRAVLEIDSREFHYDDADYDATLDRATQIRSRGLDTLHVTPRMITRSPEVFVTRTRRWLGERATLLGVPPPFAA